MENNLTLYAGWIPERDTLYTIRHMNAGSEEPFYEETGTGNSGDRIVIQPLDPSDPMYPADTEADAAHRFAVLGKEQSENIYTIVYKKKDVSVPDAAEIPDTGDRAHVVERLAMAAVAAGSGGVVLLCVRRIYAKLMRREE